mgnify:CR=1 FL=1
MVDYHNGMLNPFPIQFLAPLAYLILRLTISLILISLARRQLKAYNTKSDPRLVLLIVIEVSTASLLILGAFTQIAALVTILIGLGLTKKRLAEAFGITDRLLPGLLIGAAITLFITGAGALAFDLPI